MDTKAKDEYKELERFYSDFYTLYSDHYEDLKLYALMYRNIPLYKCANDVYSVLFFAFRKDEIIGYKQRLMSQKSTDKVKIVFMYYENEALFPKYCIKYANVNFQPNSSISDTCVLERGSLSKFKANDYPSIFSVNDLSESDCKNILLHKNLLKKEYPGLYDKYLGEVSNFHLYALPEYNDKIYFAEFRFLPLVNKSIITSVDRLVISFIESKIGANKVTEESRAIKEFFDLNIIPLEDKVREFSKKLLDLKNNDDDMPYYHPYYGSNPYYLRCIQCEREIKQEFFNFQSFSSKRFEELKQRLKSLEASRDKWEENKRKAEDEERRLESQRRIDKERQISSIEKEIQCANEEIANKRLIIQKRCLSYDSFRVLYDNREEVDKYIGSAYEIEYNAFWLDNPTHIREYESCYIFKPSFIKLLSDYKKWTGRVFKPNLAGIQRTLMNRWCDAIDREREENNRKVKEMEEERRRIKDEQERIEEAKRREKFRYNQRNRHSRDAILSFDAEKHIYTVRGKVLESVTTLVDNSFPKFDAQERAKYTAAKNGMSVQEVIDMWERKGRESRELGTSLHQKIDNYYQGITSYEDPTFRLFKMFAEKNQLNPYRSEWGVYDYDLGVAGTIDFVDYQDGEYSIYDWKRSEKIISNGLPLKANQYGEKGCYPLEHLDNSPYYHYAMQLSIYKYILERNYDIKITHLRLGIFHPSYARYYVLEMPYLANEAETLLKLHSEVIF